MRKLEACDDRALVLEDNHLAQLRWGAEPDRFPLSELKETPGVLTRDDKGKMLGVFGSKEERRRGERGDRESLIRRAGPPPARALTARGEPWSINSGAADAEA